MTVKRLVKMANVSRNSKLWAGILANWTGDRTGDKTADVRVGVPSVSANNLQYKCHLCRTRNEFHDGFPPPSSSCNVNRIRLLFKVLFNTKRKRSEYGGGQWNAQ